MYIQEAAKMSGTKINRLTCSWPLFCEQAEVSGQVPAYWSRYELVVSFPRATSRR